jgi:hypothetical protein
VVLYIRYPHRVGSGRTQQKSRAALWRGEIQKAPGLTIDQIVVSKRTQGCTPNGISLYARWLLLGELPRISIDLDFDNASEAEAYLGALRHAVYSSRQASPVSGEPQTRIVEVVEARQY